MTEGRNAHRSNSSTSFIPVPVMTPRPVQSSLPSSLSLPQLALQSQPRAPSGSGIVTPQPSPGSTSLPSNQTTTPASGKSTFRAFRNLLPFGSGKVQSPNTSITPKGRTLSLGRPLILERKSTTERKVTEPVRMASLEYTPIVVIEGPPNPKQRDFLSASSKQVPLLNNILPLSSPLALKNDGDLPPLFSSLGPPLGDLSTILESETSGVSMSKHIPLLDDPYEQEDRVKQDDCQTLSPHARGKSTQSPDSMDTSAFDLSISKLSEEVRDAMSEVDGKGDWLGGVVVEDLPSAQEVEASDGRVHDVSFNLSALDPDLAALLSPNRLMGPQSAPTFVPKSIPSPRQASHETQPSPAHSEFSYQTRTSPFTSEAWSSSRPSCELTSRHSSPLQSKNSLSASTSSRSPTSVPRLARPRRSEITSIRPHSVYFNSGDTRPSSSVSVRKPPLSASVIDDYGSLKRVDSTESHSRRSLSSRLGTPARMSTFHYPPTSRPPLRHLVSSSSPWEVDSVSPSSRASSSLGTTASRKPFGSRPSIDSEVRSSLDQDRTSPFQTRNRSMSDSPPVSISTTYRSASTAAMVHSVPGPRTTKLFKAAGLMSNDEDAANRALVGRSPERDLHHMAPSRSGHSEISRTSSSWGRTRTGTISESASVRGCTPFSASTAPTTVSATSLQNQESEIQNLKDKHQMDTDALLAALYDSQNMNKMLREENAGLRDKILDLEDQNLDLLDRLRRPSLESPPINRYPSHDSMPRTGSVEALYKRTRPPRLQPLFPPPEMMEKGGMYRSASLSLRQRNSISLDPTSFLDGSIGKRSSRKRASISSSVFQAPPSNMSMLNDDDDEALPPRSGGFSTDSASPSPTLVFSKLQHAGIHHNQSLSSPLGSVSPTTANFSSVQDSPTSLRLLSDHEDHLGDMASLDLQADFDMEG